MSWRAPAIVGLALASALSLVLSVRFPSKLGVPGRTAGDRSPGSFAPLPAAAGYHMERVATLSYGAGPAAVGLRGATPRSGPPSIAPDGRGGLLVLDAANARTLQLSASGQVRGAVPAHPAAFFVTAASGDRLLEYTPLQRLVRVRAADGSLLQELRVPDALRHPLRAREATDGVRMETAWHTSFVLATAAGPLPWEQVLKTRQAGLPAAGAAFSTRRIDGATGVATFTVPANEGPRTCETPIRTCTALLAVRPLGADRQGHGYGLLECRDGGQLARHVARIDRCGEIAAAVTLPTERSARSLVDTAVDDDGAIWHLQLADEGARVLRWSWHDPEPGDARAELATNLEPWSAEVAR